MKGNFKKILMASMLTGTMLVGMIPMNAMAGQARAHEHDWTIKAKGYKIIGECANDDCNIGCLKAELYKNNYGVRLKYDYSWEDANLFDSIVDLSYSIQYEGVNGTEYDKTYEYPSEEGTYKATVSYMGEIAELIFENNYEESDEYYEDDYYGDENINFGEMLEDKDIINKLVLKESDKEKIKNNTYDVECSIIGYDKYVREQNHNEIMKAISNNYSIKEFFNINLGVYLNKVDYDLPNEEDFYIENDLDYESYYQSRDYISNRVDEIKDNLNKKEKYIQVDETKEKIKVYVKIENKNNDYNYEIVKCSDCKVEFIDSTEILDENGTKYIMFETDDFYEYNSYAVVYNQEERTSEDIITDKIFVPAVETKGCDITSCKEYFLEKETLKMYSDIEGKNEISNNDIIKTSKSHDLIQIPAKAAVCYEKGNKEFYICIRCSKLFKEKEAKNLVDLMDMTILRGHKLEKQETEASCTGWGVKEHYKCKSCAVKTTDKEGFNEIEYEKLLLNPTGHSIKAVKEQMATCDSNGLKAHYECMECGKLYSDVKGKKEIAKSDVVINAKEHSMIFNKGKDATCTEDGVKEHYSCLVCNKKYSDKEGKMELSNNDIIKSKGHTEYIIPGYSATCSDNGITDGVKCSKCNKVLKEQQVVIKTGHNISYRGLEEPTYTEEGHMEHWECVNCGEIYADYYGIIETNKDLITLDKLQLGVTNSIKATAIKSSAITFAWDKVKGATGYRVYIAKNGQWVQLKQATYANSFTATKLASGTSYSFAVKAYRIENGKVIWSNAFKYNTFKTLPGKTSKIIAKSEGKGKVRFNWTKVKGATAYRLYYKQNGNWITLQNSISKNTVSVINLKAGRNYTFAIKACTKGNGKIVWSDCYTAFNVKIKK